MTGGAHRHGRAARAYASATAGRSWRSQEADIFRQVNYRLNAARAGTPMDRVRALADTARLWNAMAAYLQDPLNGLPVGTRSGLLSIGHAVERCLADANPDFDFLLAVNENIAAGLAAGS